MGSGSAKGRRLRCPDEEYRYLQRLRDWLITDKVTLRDYERRSEESRRAGRLEDAERWLSMVRSPIAEIRRMERAIKELEERCFGAT